mmetsp:Transcript_102894/g.296277  ORF Transcript_102894/g.296277 Transcript_102894/m.296277 type:complete len:218 (+) Transcript_102894:353-1006(+)
MRPQAESMATRAKGNNNALRGAEPFSVETRKNQPKKMLAAATATTRTAANVPCTNPCSSSPTRLLLIADMIGNCSAMGPVSVAFNAITCHNVVHCESNKGYNTDAARQMRRVLTSPSKRLSGLVKHNPANAEAPEVKAMAMPWSLPTAKYPVMIGVVIVCKPAAVNPEITRMKAIRIMKVFRINTFAACFAVPMKLKFLATSLGAASVAVSGKASST